MQTVINGNEKEMPTKNSRFSVFQVEVVFSGVDNKAITSMRMYVLSIERVCMGVWVGGGARTEIHPCLAMSGETFKA